MPFSPPFNPQVVSPGKFRRFSGVAGLPNQVLKKADENGRDLSDSFANDIQDLNCDVKGQLHLREGHIKLGDGRSSSVASIFMVQLSGAMQYGVIDTSGLTLYDVPWIPTPQIPPYEPPQFTDDYPDTFDKPTPTPDPTPSPDPSVPPEQQSCEIQHVHSTSPSALNFTMEKGGTLPATQNWFWQVRGWWPIAHVGTYDVSPVSGGYTWAIQYETQCWSWLVKPCDGVLVKAVRVSIQTAAQSLAAGTYTWNDYLLFTDSDTHTCTVTLNVTNDLHYKVYWTTDYGGTNWYPLGAEGELPWVTNKWTGSTSDMAAPTPPLPGGPGPITVFSFTPTTNVIVLTYAWGTSFTFDISGLTYDSDGKPTGTCYAKFGSLFFWKIIFGT